MRAETSLIACSSRFKTITTTSIYAVKQAHELGSGVPVVILEQDQISASIIVNNQGMIRAGGRNVRDAISHLGLKINRSARGVPGVLDLAVSTQKIDGSMWSLEIEPTLTNFSIAYLYGT